MKIYLDHVYFSFYRKMQHEVKWAIALLDLTLDDRFSGRFWYSLNFAMADYRWVKMLEMINNEVLMGRDGYILAWIKIYDWRLTDYSLRIK